MAKILVALLLCVIIGGGAVFVSTRVGSEVTDRGIDVETTLNGAVVDAATGTVTGAPPAP